MAIPVVCSCGGRFQAKEEHAGKTAKCPACGIAIEIPGPFLEPEATPTITSLTAKIGAVESATCRISISLHVSEKGAGSIVLSASDPTSRREPTYVCFGKKQVGELRELLAKTDDTVESLLRRRQMLKMLE
jgi:hypothetical protein